MREAKFRAWHKKRKKYYKVLHLHIASIMEGVWATCEGYSIIEQKEIHIQIQPQDCIIEQFTGLHDKNGKEIFEGDILKSGSFYIGDTNHCSKINHVVFECASFCTNDIPEHEWEYSEIIGNIHENPELLK